MDGSAPGVGGLLIRPTHRARIAALGGILAALFCLAVPAAAGRAWAAQAGPAVAGRHVLPDAGSVSIVITSVNPDIAKPGGKITVSGSVVNTTANPVAGPLTVQLWSANSALTSASQLSAYMDSPGGITPQTQIAGATVVLPQVGAGAAVDWSLTVPVSELGLRTFGAYPLAAQLVGAGGVEQIATAHTFLPFWPAAAQRRGQAKLRVGWIWPLIATPERTACPRALLSNSLAAAISPSGRLGVLLAAGTTGTAVRAHLTWAIDPALLSDVAVMTAPYRTGATAGCGGVSRPASTRARDWLAAVRHAAAQQDYFTTPYDDVDVAALAHRPGLSGQLQAAFTDARTAAHQFLGAVQRTVVQGSAKRGLASTGYIAWPPDGIADYAVLESLAVNQIGTVVLDSSMMPPATTTTVTPSAVTSTPNGIAGELHVLLADDNLTRLLSTPATADVPGTVSGVGAGAPGGAARTPIGGGVVARASDFAEAQWFLAQTAMIAAQAPRQARALVVAPPRRWDPSAGLAASLLADTVQAPWIQPETLGTLVHSGPTTSPGLLEAPRQLRISGNELRPSLLRRVRRLAGLVGLQASIITPPKATYLSTALAAVESSAWRGDRANQAHARALLEQVQAYVLHRFAQVKIIDSGRITLGGKSGDVPVSITNRLPYPVTVGLRVTVPDGVGVTIGSVPRAVQVAAGSSHTPTSRTVKIPVQTATAGSTTLTLQLTAPNGIPLPGPAATVTVQATHFGTMAIVIIGIALLVFVVTAVARALRRGGMGGRAPGPQAGPGGGGPTGQGAAADRGAPHPDEGTLLTPDGQTDTVEAERADPERAAPERADAGRAPKETDDHPSATDRSGRTPPR